MNRLATRLNLEQLADRIVPTVIDLTTAGAEGMAAGAIVRQVDGQSHGTEPVRSFVRLRSDGTERGYNTDARPLQFDEKRNHRVTHALKLDDVPTVDLDGVRYREFRLDINQKWSAPKLSLDEVRLYLGTAPDLRGYNGTTKQLAGLDSVYDLDSDGNVSVTLNGRLNRGHGRGDMTLLVPETAFGTAPESTYVYLYSKFGGVAGHRANAGFEEWAVRGNGGYGGGTAGNPNLNSLSGYVFLENVISDGIQQPGEPGIAGVNVHLSGTNSLGEPVYLMTTTDANGYYEFANLLDGTYTLTEEQPMDYADGIDSLGTAGGQQGSDVFTEILLAGGIHGLFYNFGENTLDENS